MEKERAIELLIQAVDEIPHLKTLHYQNDEMKLWLDKVGNILRAGLKPEDYSKYWPVSQELEILRGVYEDNIYQEEYLKKITNYEIALKSILLKYEILGIVGDEGGEVAMTKKTDNNKVKRTDKITELSDFYEDLFKYYEILSKFTKEGQIDKEKDKIGTSLLLSLGRRVGYLGKLITELTGLKTVDVHGTEYDMWVVSLKIPPDKLSLSALGHCIQVTNRAIGKLKSDIEKGVRDKQGNVIGVSPKDAAELPSSLFDKMQFHPKIINASRALFEDEHYAQAIFEAFKAVENFVQDKSDLNLYGTNLMERVFNEENPIIKVPEAGHYYKDVQRGFKHLFIGASQGIRNPKAHKEIIQKDPYITLQYLGFFSFLLKRIDYWEAGVS